jgi:hypothetical protein
MALLLPLPGHAVLELAEASGSPMAGLEFRSAVLLDAVNAPRTWAVSLLATDRATYENHIVPLLLSSDRTLRLRWGAHPAEGAPVWTPWETCRIKEARPQLEAAGRGPGLPFTLTLVSRMYDLSREQKVVARTGTVSAMVAEIAASYQLEAVIEPTGGDALNLVQSYQTDLEFLLERLRPAALNVAGFGSYYCWMAGDVLHFHTRDYQQAPDVLPYNLLPAASQLEGVDGSPDLASAGGGGVQTVAYDPLAARVSMAEAEPERYRRLAEQLPATQGLWRDAAHVGPNQLRWAQAVAQGRYAAARDRYQRVAFIAPNLPAVQAGRLLELQLPNGGALAGTYFVELMELTLVGGTASAAITAVRGELAAPVRPERGSAVTPALPVTFAATGVSLNSGAVGAPIASGVAVKPAGG